MRVPGQERVALALGPIGQLFQEQRHFQQRERALLADVQPQIERDLIVPRARRVQHAGFLAERPRQQRLDRHVHVFLVGQRLVEDA